MTIGCTADVVKYLLDGSMRFKYTLYYWLLELEVDA